MQAATKIYCPKCGAPNEIEEQCLCLPSLCQKCGHEFVAKERDGSTTPSPVFNVGPARASERKPTAQIGFGLVLILLGVVVFLYFAFFFNTTIEADGQLVTNFGLSNDRIAGVIGGGLIVLVGVILAALGREK